MSLQRQLGWFWVEHSPQQTAVEKICVCVHTNVFHNRDIHGLVYVVSVLSSKATGESTIVGPEFSCYPFNSGSTNRRQGLREENAGNPKIIKKIKNASRCDHIHIISYPQTRWLRNTLICNWTASTRKENTAVCIFTVPRWMCFMFVCVFHFFNCF